MSSTCMVLLVMNAVLKCIYDNTIYLTKSPTLTGNFESTDIYGQSFPRIF